MPTGCSKRLNLYRKKLTIFTTQTNPRVEPSVWRLSNRHIQDDLEVTHRGGQRIVTIAEEVFVHATPLLAEIEGVRGRYFSKRLHHAVVRFNYR